MALVRNDRCLSTVPSLGEPRHSVKLRRARERGPISEISYFMFNFKVGKLSALFGTGIDMYYQMGQIGKAREMKLI